MSLCPRDRAVAQGSPNVRVDAAIRGTPIYTRENAWLSRLDVSSLKAGHTQIARPIEIRPH